MSATGQVPSRGRRHLARNVIEAERMFAGGWSKAELARRFDVSPSTIGRWVDPNVKRRKAAMADRVRSRAAAARGAHGLGRGHERPEFKLARMRALRDAGLKDAQIARVMRFDFGDPLSAYAVKRALDEGQYPSRKPPARRAAA